MERTRDNRCELHQEKFHLILSAFFYSKNNQSLEETPQGYGSGLTDRSFQDVTC